ncbi:MAG: PAS domain-containing protein [Nitrospirae bacterium]|nr:PAS domain-containing protein [Nitrospirota bacterium]
MTRLLRLLPNHWPIGVKLFVLIVAVAVIPLAIGFYLAYQDGKRILLEQGVHHLDAYAGQVAQNVDDFLGHRLSEVRALAGDPALRAQEPASGGAQRMAAFLRLDPAFLGAVFAEGDGSVRFSAGQQVPDHPREREFFRKALAGREAVSRPFVEGGRALLAYAVPMKTDGGAIDGVLILYASAEELWRLVERMRDRVLPGSVVILSDKQGIRLAHSTRRDLVFQAWAPLSDREAQDLLARKELGSDVQTIPGTDLPEVHAAVREATPPRRLRHRLVIGGVYDSILVPLKQADWVLLHSFPEEALLAPLEELRRHFIFYLTLVLIVAVLISIAATWYAIRPVQLFIRAAERVRAGDLAARVTLRRQDEIGALAQTFNEMVREIHADRKEIARSFQQAQLLKEYYEGIIRETTVMVFLVGADGRFHFVNRKAEEILAYAPGELVGRTCESMQAVRNDQFHQAFARMFEERGKMERVEIPLLAKDGSVRLMLCTMTVLRSPTGEAEAAVFGLDVTEERALEEKWERIDKLASLGQLAAGVAHEMRNYLTPILGHAELLQRQRALTEEGRVQLAPIFQGAQGLQRLVRQLTGYARPSEGTLRPVSPAPVIEEVLSFVQKEMARRRIAKEVYMEQVPLVQADPGGLEQIFLNLITNALHAMGSFA